MAVTFDGDGCTHWFDGDWRHCCDAHDLAYLSGQVSLADHLDLAVCVAGTSGGLLMAVGMGVATTAWWLWVHVLKRLKKETDQ